METDIVGYQDELRKNIQSAQMKEYVTIGNEHMQEFYDHWQKRFEDFARDELEKIQDLEVTHET